MASNTKLSNNQIQLVQDMIFLELKKSADNVGDLLFVMEKELDLENEVFDNVASVIDKLFIDFRKKITAALKI